MKVSNVEQIHLPSQTVYRYPVLWTANSNQFNIPLLAFTNHNQLIIFEITLFHTIESHVVWALQAGKK